MKKYLLFLLLVFTFLGCSSTKKMSEHSMSLQNQSSKNEKSDSNFFTRIDTTKTSEYEFTYTKIEFYNPAGNGKEFKSKEEAAPNEEGLNVDEVDPVPSVSKKPPNGAIKSIEQLSVKKKDEAKGQTEASASIKSENEQSDTTNEDVAGKVEETPVPDPKRWKYIFYLALLGVSVFIYIKRTPIFKGIKKLFFKE